MRPLALGELLDQAFTFYRKHFSVIVAITALPYLADMLVAAVLQVLQPRIAVGQPLQPFSPGQIEWTVASAVAGMTVGLLAMACASAGVTFAFAAVTRQEPVHAMTALRQMRGRIFAVAGTALLMAVVLIAMAAPLAALVIPVLLRRRLVGMALLGVAFMVFIVLAMLLYVAWAVSFAAATLEPVAGIGALRRSARLTRGFRSRVFLAGLVYAALQYVVGTIFVGGLLAAFGLRGLAAAPNSLALRIVGVGFGYASHVILSPILTLLLTVLYFDLRVRKEGLDLELLLHRAEAAAGV